MLRAKGWQTLCEPIIKTSNTWVKPDIITWKEDQSVVIDAIVHSDASKYSPNKFHFDKVAKYEAIPEVTTYVKNLTGHAPKFSALAMNWRGIITPQTEQDMRSLRIRKKRPVVPVHSLHRAEYLDPSKVPTDVVQINKLEKTSPHRTHMNPLTPLPLTSSSYDEPCDLRC